MTPRTRAIRMMGGKPSIAVVWASSFANSASVALPSMEENDVVLFFAAYQSFNTVSDVAGYTQRLDFLSSAPTGRIFYKVMGSTPDTTAEVTASSDYDGTVLVLRNVDPAVFDVSDVKADGATGRPNPPSIAPVSDNSMIIVFGILGSVLGGITVSSGFTEDANYAPTGGVPYRHVVGHITQQSAAAIDPATFGGSVSAAWRAATIAIRRA